MTHSPFNKIVVLKLLLVFLIVVGCKKPEEIEPPKVTCLDITKLDESTVKAKQWVVNDSVSNALLVDNNGIEETFLILKNDTSEAVSITDSCGKSYGSFTSTVYYDTSISPINMIATVHGSGVVSEGFYLRLSITNTNNKALSKGTTYDFEKQQTREGNASVNVLPQFKLLKKIYTNVMAITFSEIASETDVKTVYYAQGYGIIMFIKENGNTFTVKY